MSAAIRNIRGQFVSKRDARIIASQVTTLPIEGPQTPHFIERGKHWHEGCSCWCEAESPSLWSQVGQWIHRGRGQ